MRQGMGRSAGVVLWLAKLKNLPDARRRCDSGSADDVPFTTPQSSNHRAHAPNMPWERSDAPATLIRALLPMGPLDFSVVRQSAAFGYDWGEGTVGWRAGQRAVNVIYLTKCDESNACHEHRCVQPTFRHEWARKQSLQQAESRKMLAGFGPPSKA